jgi:glutamate dehydrogenase
MIRRILCARVDLFYNGGIGTYVKSSGEDDADVGDRANDRVRVDGSEVRARVIGEGGNLGLTQRGRLECAAGGVMLNTDAVDNSGGVDMSDHEVNIKILLDVLMKKGVLGGRNDRNRILAEMTDEVADLVLLDNANQARAISLDALRSRDRYEEFAALVEDMVGAGILNRADDAIPTRDELLSAKGREQGLPRPLLAVLLGHTKMWAFEMAMETDLPDSAAAAPFLPAYFPKRLAEFAGHFAEHPLRREIVGTAAVNHLVNHAGIAFLSRVMAATKAGLGEVIAAYLEADDEMKAAGQREKVLGSGLDAAAEHKALLEIEDRLEAATRARLAPTPAAPEPAAKAGRTKQPA